MLLFRFHSYTLFIFFTILFSEQAISQQSSIIDSLLHQLKSSQSDSEKVVILNDLSWEWVSADINKSKTYANAALSIAVKTKFQAGIASSYNMLATAFDYAGEYDSSLVYFDKSLALRRKLKDKYGVANVLNNIGASFYFRSDFKNALFYYIEAEKIRSEINDLKGLSQSLNNIGLIQRYTGDYKQSVETYKKSMAIKEKLGDLSGKYNTCINLGAAYQNIAEYDSSILYSQHALKYANLLNDSVYISSAYINLAKAYNKLKQYKIAIEHLTNAERILSKTDNLHDRIYCLSTLGETYFAQGNYVSAIKYLELAREKSKLVQRNELLVSVMYTLSEAYKNTGNTHLAYNYLKEYIQLKDSAFALENEKNLRELKVQFETELKESELVMLRNEKVITQLSIDNERRNKQLLIAILLFVVIVTLLVVAALFQKSKSNKQISKQKEIIETSLREKEILLKEIHHRVKNNLQIITGVLELQESLHASESTKQIVEEAQGRIKTMALIHEMLYNSSDIEFIDFEKYVASLVNVIATGYSGSLHTIDTTFTVSGVKFNIDTTIPLGLILNELISNSYKHVFSKNKGNQLHISIKNEQADWVLTVYDNGPGFDATSVASSSFGLRLVRMLVRQLKGSINIENVAGSKINITFKQIG